jgi:hypothetical protein
MNKGACARLVTYRLRLAMPGGPMLPRKAAVLIGHSPAVGDKGNTVSVSEPMLTYRTEVKEVYYSLGAGTERGYFCI